MKGYEAIARALSDAGVDTLFGLMGDANMLHINAFTEGIGGRYVAAVDERGAMAMADGYSRRSGKVGVATVTHGPATTNTLTSLIEAVRAGSSTILITGEPVAKRYFPQEMDLEGFARLAGARYWRVRRAEHLVDDVAMLLAQVRTTRHPVVLDVPFDLQFAEVDYVTSPFVAPPAQWLAPEPEALDDALGVMLSARRPLILAGRGALVAGAGPALSRLAERLGAPLATTAGAKDMFVGHPFDLGVIGTVTRPRSAEVLSGVDCLVVFGAGLNDHTTVGGSLVEDRTVIRCDIAPERLLRATAPHTAVLGDARLVAEEMMHQLEEAGVETGGWRTTAMGTGGSSDWDSASDFRDRSSDGALDPRSVMIRLDEILPADRQVVTDVGRFVVSPWRYLRVPSADRFFQTGGNWSSIGLAVGAAVGAAAAALPGETTICVAGDGGAMMGLVEVSTAVRHGLPLILIVLNDRCYGAEYPKLENHGIDPAFAYLAWPSMAEIGRALGGNGVRVSTMADLDQAVQLATSDAVGVTIIEVLIDPTIDPGVD